MHSEGRLKPSGDIRHLSPLKSDRRVTSPVADLIGTPVDETAGTITHHALRAGTLPLHNFRHQASNRRMQLEKVQALLIALEAKDAFTAQHSVNVRRLAEEFGKLLDIKGASLLTLCIAALLHDVGKITIPDAILKKPGALTSDEYAVIKTHAALGAKMVEQCQFPAEVVELVKHHHEWNDGRGYPTGLSGDEIPFRARILLVADCVDAMMSPRCYRAPLSIEDVIRELRLGSGLQFDPTVAAAAVQWMENAENAASCVQDIA